MSAPRRWRIGDVTVTRIVESLGTPPPLFASVSPKSRIVSDGATWRFAVDAPVPGDDMPGRSEGSAPG
jgi:hypothetical protein